jgi:hypothetical protein
MAASASRTGVTTYDIQKDGKGQPYLEWEIGYDAAQGRGGFKRAWIQHREADKDWAGTGRYLNVVRVDELGKGPSGNATDFPIFSKLSDEQILIAFVSSVCAITGCVLTEPS